MAHISKRQGDNFMPLKYNPNYNWYFISSLLSQFFTSSTTICLVFPSTLIVLLLHWFWHVFVCPDLPKISSPGCGWLWIGSTLTSATVTNLITLEHTALSVYDNVALLYIVQEHVTKTKFSMYITLKLYVVCKFISTQHKLYNYKFCTCMYITCILCKWKHVNCVVQTP